MDFDGYGTCDMFDDRLDDSWLHFGSFDTVYEDMLGNRFATEPDWSVWRVVDEQSIPFDDDYTETIIRCVERCR